jgi:hypothetical protein
LEWVVVTVGMVVATVVASERFIHALSAQQMFAM